MEALLGCLRTYAASDGDIRVHGPRIRGDWARRISAGKVKKHGK